MWLIDFLTMARAVMSHCTMHNAACSMPDGREMIETNYGTLGFYQLLDRDYQELICKYCWLEVLISKLPLVPVQVICCRLSENRTEHNPPGQLNRLCSSAVIMNK